MAPQTKLEGLKNGVEGQQCAPMRLFTDASKEGCGARINDHAARRTWSLPESKLHINYLELKAVFLALKEFQYLCQNNIVLITLTTPWWLLI